MMKLTKEFKAEADLAIDLEVLAAALELLARHYAAKANVFAGWAEARTAEARRLRALMETFQSRYSGDAEIDDTIQLLRSKFSEAMLEVQTERMPASEPEDLIYGETF